MADEAKKPNLLLLGVLAVGGFLLLRGSSKKDDAASATSWATDVNTGAAPAQAPAAPAAPSADVLLTALNSDSGSWFSKLQAVAQAQAPATPPATPAVTPPATPTATPAVTSSSTSPPGPVTGGWLANFHAAIRTSQTG